MLYKTLKAGIDNKNNGLPLLLCFFSSYIDTIRKQIFMRCFNKQTINK